MKRFIVALFVIAVLSLNVDANAAAKASGSKSSGKSYTSKTYAPKAEKASPGFWSSAFGGSKSYIKSDSKPAAKSSGSSRSAWAK